MKITKIYSLTMPDGTVNNVEFRITADISYTPGHTSGAPEDCYPEDGSSSITNITNLTEFEGVLDNTLVQLVINQKEEEIYTDLWIAFYEARNNGRQEAAA